MKFSLDGLKNTNWKALLADHGEKIGLAVAVLVAAAVLFTGRWGRYVEKVPAQVLNDVDVQEKALRRSVWTVEQKTADLPDFNVKEEAQRVKQKLSADEIMLSVPLTGPIHPLQEPGSEPTWLKIEDLRADYVALPVKLVPLEDLEALESGLPVEPEEDEIPGDFKVGGDQGGAASFFGEGFGGDYGSDPAYDEESMYEESMYEEEGDMYGEEGMEGYAPVESNARGKGVKMVAVRGVFPFHRQIKELATSLNLSFAEAKPRLEFLNIEIQRQRAAPGPNPWTEDWEFVDREAAEELLAEDATISTGQAFEVVSPSLTDPSLTMPLLTRAFGSWAEKPEATHPRLKEFDLDKESPELRRKIEELLRQQTVEQEEIERAAGPQRTTFGPKRRAASGYDEYGYDPRAAAAAVIAKADADQEDDDPVTAVIRRMTAADILLLTRFFDIAVEPGQAYRYRMRLEVANPNFGLSEADVSDPSALEGETRKTTWSDPSNVAVIPPDEFAFLTTVYPKPQDMLPEARLEVTEFSREYGTLVAKDTRVDAGDLLAFEERNTYTMDPFKLVKDEKATYPFVTDYVVIGVDALPDDAAALHPDLNLGNRKLPPGRALLLMDTGVVREIDAGLESARRKIAASVKAMQDGLGPQLTDKNAPPPMPEDQYGYDEYGYGE